MRAIPQRNGAAGRGSPPEPRYRPPQRGSARRSTRTAPDTPPDQTIPNEPMRSGCDLACSGEVTGAAGSLISRASAERSVNASAGVAGSGRSHEDRGLPSQSAPAASIPRRGSSSQRSRTEQPRLEWSYELAGCCSGAPQRQPFGGTGRRPSSQMSRLFDSMGCHGRNSSERMCNQRSSQDS